MTTHHVPTSSRALRPGLRRLRAPNPGLMTGTGTNTYLLGTRDLIVIDPGPAISDHIEAILDAAARRIAWICVTHTHLDHSPAARALADRAGAPIAGPIVPSSGGQDRAFTADRLLRHGDTIAIGDVLLTVIETPGHASNHVCFWSLSERELFTGDHINEGSTVVINPPDGNMRAYLDSLERLKALGPCTLLPGHGEPIEDSITAIDDLIAHRLERETKVLAALREDRYVAVEDLLGVVYADVDARLHPIAARSLLAHLIKLEEDGRANCERNRWRRR